MGSSLLKSSRSRMRGNNLSYKIFKGVNCGGSFFYEIGLMAASSFVLTFLGCGQLLSNQLTFLSRLVCDHDRLSCCSDIVLQC